MRWSIPLCDASAPARNGGTGGWGPSADRIPIATLRRTRGEPISRDQIAAERRLVGVECVRSPCREGVVRRHDPERSLGRRSRSRTSGRRRVEAIASAGSGIGVIGLADVGIVHKQVAAAKVEGRRSWTSAAVVGSQRQASRATSLRGRAGLLVGRSRVRLGRRRRDAHLWRVRGKTPARVKHLFSYGGGTESWSGRDAQDRSGPGVRSSSVRASDFSSRCSALRRHARPAGVPVGRTRRRCSHR